MSEIADLVADRLKNLQKLATPEDYKDIRRIVEEFKAAMAAKNRTAMVDLSKAAFPLEKKYIPDLNQTLAAQLPCETMILTVGFQKEPLILSILTLKPRQVILLHTESSRQVAQAVEADPDVKMLSVRIYLTSITEFDATKNYQVMRDEVLPKTISARGAILADPTGGRKVMVASLALVAFFHRLPMVYVHTLEVIGVAFPFMETLQIIQNPFEFFGDTELSLIQDHFNRRYYDAAVQVCLTLQKSIRDLATDKKISLIQELAEIYRDWDTFSHSLVSTVNPEARLHQSFLGQRLKQCLDELSRFGLKGLLSDAVLGNLEFLFELEKTWRPKRNIVDVYRLVDVFCAAERRASQGKYDDAVARLYRCLEICSTLRLAQLGLTNPSKPDYQTLAASGSLELEQIRQKFQELKGRGLPEKLGLEDQMTLLNILGDTIANIYASMKNPAQEADSLMGKRNLSILAHGTSPITKEDWPAFAAKAQAMIQNVIGQEEFRRLYDKARHGEICLSSFNQRL